MMKPISHSLRDVLVRQGIANAKPVGAGKVRGMDAGLPKGERTDPLTDAAHREGPRIRSGMGKTGAAKAPASVLERQEREPTPQVRRVLLTVVASNKCLPRETPMRGPRNSLGRHLSLVWSA